ATFLEIARSPVVEHRVPLLGSAFRDVGAVQIQARGTLGGNLATASPAADGVAALAALDATLVLASVRGTRRVPLAAFYTGYKRSLRASDEAIVRIEIELPPRGARWSWRKVGTRRAQSISKVALAAVAELDGTGPGARVGRIGLGMASVAPTVTFLDAVRSLVLGRTLLSLASVPAAELDAAVDAGISPIDDIRSTAAYRRHVARALVRTFLGSGLNN
ncbi:MAG: FAD binding domain-containing protein, partial [Chloroflexota bacterium]